jgi:hypothetical protein
VLAPLGHRFRRLLLAVAAMTSSSVRATTVCGVVVVAVIAAVVSYSHMQQLAVSAGEDWRSWLIPLSIDGLVVAASMVLLTRRRTGLPGGPLAWGALGAGVMASLAANMADARPDITAVLVAGWPAAAFAVAFELLLQQRRAEQHDPDTMTGALPVPPLEALAVSHGPMPYPSVTAPSARTVAQVLPVPAPASVVTTSPAPARTAPEQVPASSRVSRATNSVDGDAELVARVRALLNESDGPAPGRRAIAKRLGVSEHQARVALDLVGATTGQALNGTGSGSNPPARGRGAQ